MVGGTERLRAAVRGGNSHNIGRSGCRRGEQAGEQGRLNARQVAGENQIPVVWAVTEGGFNAAERAAARVVVINSGQAQMAVAGRSADQRDVAANGADRGGDMFDERRAAVGEQRFIAPEPEAGAAGEHVSTCRHETILTAGKLRRIPVGCERMRVYNRTNKSMALCFILAGVMLLAPEARAAEPVTRTVTTVRADRRTGRLVRSTVVTTMEAGARETKPRDVAPSPAANMTEIRQVIEETSRAYQVDPLLVHSVIGVESNYDPHAVSPKGAQGIMQLIPATARRFGVVDAFDVRENITAGVKYLKYLQDMFKDERLALAAYNAGEGAVLRYGAVPPYPETEAYVYKVGRNYGEARRRQQAQAPPEPAIASVQPQAPPAEPLRSLEVATDAQGRILLRTR